MVLRKSVIKRRFAAWSVWAVIGVPALSCQTLAAQDETKEASPSVVLDPLVVTAQKQEENIQEIPASITALSDVQIEDAGIRVTEDLIYQIPNLHMVKLSNHGSGSALSMRGISTVQGDLSMSPAVGFYVDDVYYSGGLDTQLLDLERIEVLRGPQGTLYGRNTEAGVINLITRKPGNTFEGRASISYGDYNSQNYLISIGGPLIDDKLFLKFSGVYYLSDGYVDNRVIDNDDADDMDDKSLRTVLRWTPTDALDIDFTTEYLRFRDGRDNWSPSGDAYKTFTDFKGTEDTDSLGHALRAEYKGDLFILTSVSSFRNWQDDQYYDVDFIALDIYRFALEQDFDTFTQEIRLASPDNSGSLKWLGGVAAVEYICIARIDCHAVGIIYFGSI